MTQEESVAIIRGVFAHVVVQKIEVVNDPDFGTLAKVFVSDDDIDAAIGEDGINARRAAMESGIDIEVVSED